MAEKVRFKIVQWRSGDSVEKNLAFILSRIEEAQKGTTIIFPEYSMLYPDYLNIERFIEQAQDSSDSFVKSISESAKRHSVDIIINFVEKNYGKPLNTSLHINSSGKISGRYSKTHLFDSYGFMESNLYQKGHSIPEPFLLHGKFPVGIEICYDIRFPEIARLYSLMGAQVIIVQAAFYKGNYKYETWSTLLKARAMENGVFVIAADQCGEDFLGHSMVVNPYGQVEGELGEEEGDIEAEIDMAMVQEYRDSVPVIKHRRIDLYDVRGL